MSRINLGRVVGNDGKSAYEIWLEQGNTGTEQEFIASLAGKDGVGISKIEKTNTVGLIDTYTITYTDGTTSTYEVKNGANGTGEGGTSDYPSLENLPSINGVLLTGNKTTEDLRINIPTNTSDLVNDSGFITGADIPTVPTKTSELENDSGFITEEDIPEIPENTSDLINDSGFATETFVKNKIAEAQLEGSEVDISGKQDVLISGQNIKTFNGETILGSGDLTVSGVSSIATYLLIQILQNAVYGTSQAENIELLREELLNSGGTVSCSIEYVLTGVSSDNNITEVSIGDSFVANLSYTDPSFSMQSIQITMGGLDITNDVFDNMTISIPAVSGNIVITAVASNLSLDSLAYKTFTYRDIFINGNLLQGFDWENGLPSYLNLRNGNPEITEEDAVSPSHSMKLFGTISQQYNAIANAVTVTSGHTVFGALKVNCSRYIAGGYGFADAQFLSALQGTGVTDGWETLTMYQTLSTTISTGFYFGSFTSANLDCYIDDVVLIDVDNTCGEQIPQATMEELYENYIEIRKAGVV